MATLNVTTVYNSQSGTIHQDEVAFAATVTVDDVTWQSWLVLDAQTFNPSPTNGMPTVDFSATTTRVLKLQSAIASYTGSQTDNTPHLQLQDAGGTWRDFESFYHLKYADNVANGVPLTLSQGFGQTLNFRINQNMPGGGARDFVNLSVVLFQSPVAELRGIVEGGGFTGRPLSKPVIKARAYAMVIG